MTGRRHQAVLRRAVFARDHGVCAECGLDCDELLAAYRAALAQEYGAWRNDMTSAYLRLDPVGCTQVALRHRGSIKAIKQRLERLGFKPGESMWQADHVTPLEEGGPDTLENCRTLCTPHHRVATAEHAARRARRPSKRVRRAA